MKTHNDLARQRRGHRQPRHGQPAAEEARVASHVPGCPPVQCHQRAPGQHLQPPPYRCPRVVRYRALSCVGPSGKSSLSGQTGHVRLDREVYVLKPAGLPECRTISSTSTGSSTGMRQWPTRIPGELGAPGCRPRTRYRAGGAGRGRAGGAGREPSTPGCPPGAGSGVEIAGRTEALDEPGPGALRVRLQLGGHNGLESVAGHGLSNPLAFALGSGQPCLSPPLGVPGDGSNQGDPWSAPKSASPGPAAAV